MADQNKKKYIKYEDTTYILQDSRIPDPTTEDNGKVLGVVNGAYALKQEEGGSGAVTSVNGKAGAVTLSASDVHALPDSTVIPTVPTKVSELNNDAGYLTAHQSLAAYRTSADQDTIDAAQDTAIAAKYSKPSGGIPASDLAAGVIPTVPQMATQANMSDWTSGKTVDAAVLAQDFTSALTSLNNLAVEVEGKADTGSLATVATSGSYDDLSDKPSIPSLSGYATEQWVGQQGYQTDQQVQTAIAAAAELPTVTASDNGKSLVVENGVWGKGYQAARIPRVAMASTDTTPTLDPNKLYVFPEMATLTPTLATPADNSVVNEYHFCFDSGSTATVLTLPATILQPDGFTVEANTHYEISILEGAMTAQGWAVSSS